MSQFPVSKSREPIIAWREWSFLYPNYLLDRGKFQAWEPRVRYEARCRANEEHLAPDLSCSCGIYAYNSREGVINDFPREIIGQVYLWGRVIEHEHGYRAQFAYPKSLIIINESILAQAGWLSYKFGVPVDSIKLEKIEEEKFKVPPRWTPPRFGPVRNATFRT